MKNSIKILHIFIIISFLLQIIYGIYQVFWVVIVDSNIGPLFKRGLPFELMLIRRGYATETWVAIVGLSLYLAITEVLPEKLNKK